MLKEVREAGFECSDMSSFYSSITGGFRVNVDGQIIQMAHGVFRLTCCCTDGFFGYELHTLEDTWLYDMVVRYVFEGIDRKVVINDKVVPKDTAKYWQYPVEYVDVDNIRVRVRDSYLDPHFRQEMYARPHGDAWIVHARAMSHIPHLLALKDTRGFSSVWYGTPEETQKLWRRRELDAPIYETQIQPHCLVPKDTTMRIITEAAYV